MTGTSSITRSGWGRCLLAPFSVIALVLAFLVATAGPAAAASEADYVGLGSSATIWGRVGGSGSWQRYTAGEMLLAIDGGETVVGYCIDLHTSINTASGADLPEVPWSLSGIANLDKVSYVLHTYQPGSSLLSGTDDQKAAAIQAAIWHLTDGFNLRTDGGNSATVIASYNAILASIPDVGLPTEPAPSLAITPAVQSAFVGQTAGPFTVDTTGSDLPLTVPAGIQVVDWATGVPLTTVSDGDVFGIIGSGVGTVEVSASASATIHAGRVFARLDASGDPVVQRLILAERSDATTSASVSATFTEEPTTTTTTVPDSTTTTVPGSTTTTVPGSTTTTEAEVLGAVVERELPRTGSGSLPLVATGVSAILVGLLAIAGRRRWELVHHES